MRRAITYISILCIITLAVFFPRVAGDLPEETGALVRKKYDSWSGVLRVWSVGVDALSLTGWLNACASSFEKQNKGVYIQIQSVDAAAIVQLGESGVNPPDMILVSPGILSSAENLLPLSSFAEVESALSTLRRGLLQSGTLAATPYLAPIAMGAYAWAYNRTIISEPPADWSATDLSLTALPDTDEKSYSASLIALCSARAYRTGTQDVSPYGIDLGLPTSAVTPEPTPFNGEEIFCRLPDSFTVSEDAYQNFINGKLAAIPVDQQALKKLVRLYDQGRGPDWAVRVTGEAAFSDQIALLGIVDTPRDDIAARQTLCASFIALVLSESSQVALGKANAFAVTDISAHAGKTGYAEIEAGLHGRAILAPNAFSDLWREKAAALLQKFAQGEITARDALAALEGAM